MLIHPRSFSRRSTALTLAALLCMCVLGGCAEAVVDMDGSVDNVPAMRTSSLANEESLQYSAEADADTATPLRPLDEPRAATAVQSTQDDSSAAPPCACGNGFRQTGIASWYGKMFHGRRTASGERYDMHAMTAAHRTLPLGACVRVSLLRGARSVVVRINDRGPFVRGRVIDLSYAAAESLGLRAAGRLPVTLENIPSSRDASGTRRCVAPSA